MPHRNALIAASILIVASVVWGCSAESGSGKPKPKLEISGSTLTDTCEDPEGCAPPECEDPSACDDAGEDPEQDTPSGGTDDASGTVEDGSSQPSDGGSNPGSDAVIKTDSDTPKPDTKVPKDAGPLSDDDKDGDGFSPKQGDCNDNDPKINPAQKETCNGKDDDCNGETDDIDKDGDGHSLCPGKNYDCDDENPTAYAGAKPDCSDGADHDCDNVPDNEQDADSDGVNVCGDCDDHNKNVFPGAPINCKNGKDNNCDGVIDAKVDKDGDGWGGCEDCDDEDATVNPGAPEQCDGKDNNCNGITDDADADGDGYIDLKCGGNDCDDKDLNINPGTLKDWTNGQDNDCNGVIDAQEDYDKDGYVGGDDCNDYNPFVNNGAIELQGDNVDNNCNGQIDEATGACSGDNLDTNDPMSYAKAIDLCATVKESSFPTLASPQARGIKMQYGPPNIPQAGKNMTVLSSGNVAATGDPGYVNPQPGTQFTNAAGYPAPGGVCQNSGSVYDFTEWKLVLQVPANALSFSYDFNFMSAEYPEWVGTQFNDKFFAILDSKAFQGNISFDAKGNCISINNGFFSVCQGCSQGATQLAGTGYDNGIGGGTGWLTTTAPVTPGETITLRFIIFDEGDHIYDSAVLIDNFRWDIKGTISPCTVRGGSCGG